MLRSILPRRVMFFLHRYVGQSLFLACMWVGDRLPTRHRRKAYDLAVWCLRTTKPDML